MTETELEHRKEELKKSDGAAPIAGPKDEKKDGFIKKLMRAFLNYETISYLVVGVLTTVVDFLVFAAANEAIQSSGRLSEVTAVMIAQVISWAAAVLFAYILNKLVVFRNYNFRLGHLIYEASTFVAARVMSGVLVTIAIWVMVDLLHSNEYAAKILTSIINIVFNYAASKLFIFKKK